MGKIIIGFIGLGLIGGSIAKNIRRTNPNYEIIALDNDPNALEWALNNNIIHRAYNQLTMDFSLCNYIFLCTPVELNTTYLSMLKTVLHPDCILTDVGSVKSHIHNAINKFELDSYFIGGHPMAGSEKHGVTNANDRLFENAYYILTPTPMVSSTKINLLKELILSLSSIPVIMDYSHHDYVVAAISHLPHIIASTLVNTVKNSDDNNEIMKQLAAGGFKDITRIASSSPIMWQQICMTNNENITRMLDSYILSLQKIQFEISNKNENFLYNMFDEAREYRNSIPSNMLGAIHKIYELFIDIIDEAGAIATLSTILASNSISIKNIGIVHNREFQDGALRIVFYNEEALNNAFSLLTKYKYTIYFNKLN